MAKVVVKLQIAEYAARVKNAANVGMDTAAQVIVGQVKTNLSRPGRFKNFKNQASDADLAFAAENGLVDPPGGMPRNVTGRLMGSITWDRPGGLRRRIGPGFGLKYARIHELGGVINHPGGTPYIIVKGRAVFLKKASSFIPGRRARQQKGGKALAAVAIGQAIKFTKPHRITIPARPYLRPALVTAGAAASAEFSAIVRGALRNVQVMK